MSDDKTKRVSQDGDRINPNEEYEVDYWKKNSAFLKRNYARPLSAPVQW